MAEREVTIKILGDASRARQAFSDAGRGAGEFEAKVTGLGGKFGTFASTFTAFAAGGALQSVAGYLKDGAQGAAEDEAALLRLRTAVENTGVSYDDYAGTLDTAIKKGQDLAFTDGETASALALLTSLTGDTDEAMRRLTSAQDLARGAGISLDQAAKLLGKTSDENTSALSRLGIQLGENATAQDVLNAVDEKFKGQAGTFAESDAGKFAKAQQNVGELAESLGSALVPAISLAAGAVLTIVTAITPLIELVSGNQAAMIGLAAAITVLLIPAFAGLAVSIGAAVVAMAPFIAIAAAVGLAVAALYLAWQTNFLGMRDIAMEVWNWLSATIPPLAEQVWSAIQGGLEALQTAWGTIWPAIQAVVDTVWPAISLAVTTYIGLVRLEIETALSIIQALWGTIWPAVQAVIETVWPIISTVVTTYIGLVRSEIETALGIIQGVWNTVWPAVQAVIETVWPIIQTIVETAMTAIRTAIDRLPEIQAIFQSVFDTVKGIVDGAINGASGIVATVQSGIDMIVSAPGAAIGAITSAWGAIRDAIVGAISGIVEPIRDAVNSAIDIVNGAIGRINSALEFTIPGVDMPGPVPDIPPIRVNPPDIPTIPRMAAGGIIPFTPGGMLVLAGERGREAIIPLGDKTGGLGLIDVDKSGGSVPVTVVNPVTIDKTGGVGVPVEVTNPTDIGEAIAVEAGNLQPGGAYASLIGGGTGQANTSTPGGTASMGRRPYPMTEAEAIAQFVAGIPGYSGMVSTGTSWNAGIPYTGPQVVYSQQILAAMGPALLRAMQEQARGIKLAVEQGLRSQRIDVAYRMSEREFGRAQVSYARTNTAVRMG